jgi:Ca2+-binding RTX toxin-like protein
MANITGTKGNDKLTGTESDDTIKGLAGDDRIIASLGNDTIDGGAGNDVLDYSNLPRSLEASIQLSLSANEIRVSKIFPGFDIVTNVETIIGTTYTPPGTSGAFRNSIGFFADANTFTKVDLDLSKNLITYSSPSIGTKILNIKNFSLSGTRAKEVKITGDDLDNNFNPQSGQTVVIGSKGNDGMTNQNPDTTLDYSNFDRAITVINNIPPGERSPFAPQPIINVDKNGLGLDQISGSPLKRIIGAKGKANTIDGNRTTTKSFVAGINVNLANNFFAENAPTATDLDSLPIEVINFVNVIGTNLDDKIVGANKNGKLIGGGGNDNITGGSKNDRITGTDSTARGVGEVDTLTGGGGRDKFILGDKNGAYYVGKGKDDYATITDFNLFQDSIDLGGFKNYSFASGGNNTIELYSGKDLNTRDLIAKIQLAGGISSTNSNSRSIAGSSSNLDSIISKLDIIAGTSANSNS